MFLYKIIDVSDKKEIFSYDSNLSLFIFSNIGNLRIFCRIYGIRKQIEAYFCQELKNFEHGEYL